MRIGWLMCGDYVWRLCVAIMCLCVFVCMFVYVYGCRERSILCGLCGVWVCIIVCACCLWRFRLRFHAYVHADCVWCRELSILCGLCVECVWRVCFQNCVCMRWLLRFRLLNLAYVNVVCVGCRVRFILCVDYVWRVCLYECEYMLIVKI